MDLGKYMTELGTDKMLKATDMYSSRTVVLGTDRMAMDKCNRLKATNKVSYMTAMDKDIR